MQPGAIVGSSDTSIRVNASDAMQTSVEYTPLLNPTGDWSAEIWIKPTESTPGSGVVPARFTCPFSSGNFNDPRSGWLIYMEGTNGWSFRGYQNVGLGAAFQIDTTGLQPQPNVWYHVVGTWESATGTATLYVNGTAVGTQTGVTNFVPASAVGAVSSGRLHIGSRADGAFGWSGYADEAAVYATTLTALEVLSHYENGTNPARTKPYDVLVQESLPLGYWRLNQMTFDPTLPPTVVIQSAAMRGATGLMDIVFRVNDPDDATVKTRALAFIEGQRSFAKLVKPTNFAEGTGSKIGDAIATNTDHTLTWSVAADWNIDLGQIKFEILAMDNRGLLPIDWVTIPAANGQPELTISKSSPTDQAIINALYWQYANGDPGLTLENGVLLGSERSGVLEGVQFVIGDQIQRFGPAFVIRSMNLTAASEAQIQRAISVRATKPAQTQWQLINKPYSGMSLIVGWGANWDGRTTAPIGLTDVVSISAGNHNLALKSDGTVVAWGENGHGQCNVPEGLRDVTAISAGEYHSLALKNDGTLVAWGGNWEGQADVPPGLAAVTEIDAGGYFNIVRTPIGFTAWGNMHDGQIDMPENLTNIRSFAAGGGFVLALKNDGTLLSWGHNHVGQTNIPPALSGITRISAGTHNGIAIKGDGTVAAWGYNAFGASNVPTGLSNIKDVSGGRDFNLALRVDGTILAWGRNDWNQTQVPAGLKGVTAIAAGQYHSIALKSESSRP